ncbi:transglycosylase SLT domain-containing protein, partial [Oleiphilus sp. HI0117]
AKMLSSDVSKFAAKSKIEDALVYAIIETESAFNPMARSPIPAYGLMQIVPSSAGQDATQQLFGKAKILSPSYLYTSDKNIEVGTTYLNILYYRYLKGIKNELSRLYCSIAAYNTGAGNVAKAFTGKRRLKPALAKINALTPQEVYDHLIEHLPYEETRKYLAKVKKRIPKYR